MPIRFSTVGLLLILAIGQSAFGQAADQNAVSYDDIRPVLKKRCLSCHGQDRSRGDLDLSSFQGISAGSSSGPVAVAGKPDESLLYTLAAHLEDPRMPPGAPRIPQRELDLIWNWISGGLVEKSAERRLKPTTEASEAASGKPADAMASENSSKSPGFVPVQPLPHLTTPTALAASPKSSLIAVSGRKQIVLIDDPAKPPERALDFPEGDVFVLKFVKGGDVLIAAGGVGADSGRVVGFDVATGERLFEVGDEADVVLAADMSADGSLVALGGPRRTVTIYRTETGERVAELKKHTDWILSVAFSPDGLLLASSDRFGGLQIWEAETGKEFLTLRGHTGAVHALCWTDGSNELLSVGQDETARLWNLHRGEQTAQWDAGVGAILTTAVDASGRIVCGGRGKAASVTDRAGVPSTTFSASDEVVKLAIDREGKTCLCADAAGNLSQFDLSSGRLISTFTLPVASAELAVTTIREPIIHASALEPVKAPLITPAADSLPADVVAADVLAKQANADLQAVRDAASLSDAAIEAMEQALEKQRTAAAAIKPIMAAREKQAGDAASFAADLRRQAQSGGLNIEDDLNRLTQKLALKQRLLQSAESLAGQLNSAARENPDDEALKASLTLAGDLAAGLRTDVADIDRACQRLSVLLAERESFNQTAGKSSPSPIAGESP